MLGLGALFAIVGQARRSNSVVLFGLAAAAVLNPAVALLGYASYLFLFDGAYHGGYLLGSLMLFVIGSQGLTVITVGHKLRRLERKLTIPMVARGLEAE